MDVTCNRCGTVYEFEEALISTTGTTVKCTQCGHLFKVHRPAASDAGSEDNGSHAMRWRIRRVDGSTHMLESLAELTRLIDAGQFTSDDEISRTGQVWKKLGEIQEIASMFEQAPRPRRASDMSQPLPLPPPPPPTPATKTEDASSSASGGSAEPPAAPRSRRQSSERFHVMGTEVALEGQGPARTKPPSPPPPPPASAAVAETAEPDSDSAQTLNRAPAPSARDDEELRDPVRARTSRLWPWLLAVGIPLALAAGIGRTLVDRARPPPEPEDPARSFLEHGDEALGSHLPERFDEAVSEYTKALAYHRDDAHILSSISRVYAVWAQWLQARARWLRGAAGGGAELEAVQREARQLADQAKLYGERAAQRNPGNEEASVALSDALRLTGNLVAARSELDRARATEGVAAAETLRVAALLAIDEANGDLRAGRGLAEQAVARDPTLVRARVLLAEVLAQDGDFAGAYMHLDAARRDQPHAIVDETRAVIDRSERAARRIKREAMATAPAPLPPAAPKSKPQPAQDTQPAPRPRPTPAKPEERGGEAALELVSKGESALERGQVRGAERLFEQALEIEPGMPRARTGLGYVALERSQPRQAINYFRPAARGGNPEALIGLGDAYRRLGRTKEALVAYREYLERYPRGERSSIAQRQVELLTEQMQDNP